MDDTMQDTAKGPQLARRRHRGVAIWCAVVVAAMVGASFAASPLYSLLCKLTNFDGTPRFCRSYQSRSPSPIGTR